MPTKNSKSKATSSKKDYTAVLLEDMRDSIKLLAESQQGLIKKVDKLDNRMDGLDTRIDQLDMRVEETNNQFTLFVKDTEEKFRIVIDHLMRIEDELMDIKSTLKGLEERKADWQIVKDLIKRVELLEKEVAAQRSMLKAK